MQDAVLGGAGARGLRLPACGEAIPSSGHLRAMGGWARWACRPSHCWDAPPVAAAGRLMDGMEEFSRGGLSGALAPSSAARLLALPLVLVDLAALSAPHCTALKVACLPACLPAPYSTARQGTSSACPPVCLSACHSHAHRALEASGSLRASP